MATSNSGLTKAAIKRAEYLLLQYVADYRMSLVHLASPDLSGFVNQPSHHLNRERLVDLLESMFERQLLFVQRHRSQSPFLNREEIVLALNGKLIEAKTGAQVYYGLTEKGGQYWEKLARPRWDCFVEFTYSAPDSKYHPLVGTCRGISRKMLFYYMSHVTLFRERVIKEPLKYIRMTPFKATYWKTLPSGYQLRFRYTKQPQDTLWSKQAMSYIQKYAREHCHGEKLTVIKPSIVRIVRALLADQAAQHWYVVPNWV